MTQYLLDHNLLGLTIGMSTFAVIGMFHPLVIKAYYYIGLPSRWIFLALGIIAGAAAFVVVDIYWQSMLGVTAFSCFWSILEVTQQRERVRKGWFPDNPARGRHRRAVSARPEATPANTDDNS